MTRDKILKKFPSPAHTPILVSEVTRMSQGRYCVAALDIATQRMVRPLQSNSDNWRLGADRSVFHVGNLLDIRRTGERRVIMPHATEDTPVVATPAVLASFTEDVIYELLLPSAEKSVVAAIGHPLIQNRYLEDGVGPRSLGGVRAKRKHVEFREDPYGKLRATLHDSDGIVYDLPVTSDWLQHLFSAADADGEPHFGIKEANEWLCVTKPDDLLILRVGLARPWGGKDNDWSPKRCYLQLNGIVCPQDNFHIFAGPAENS
ncbi:MAG: hypothetical protein HUU15_17765 [Candidatus Brocadiae bacterium]|nr:hypothetical protein [Candidatus Brocadiia bacterium]